VLVQVDRLRLGLAGDWKSLGEGVFELRVHEGRGYRVYFGRDGKATVILLCGGDKSTQRRDRPERAGERIGSKHEDGCVQDFGYLKTQKQVVAYLNAALEDGDHMVLLEALRNVAQSRGMSALAKAAGVSRESLYRSLSRRGNPKIETIIQLLRALGLRLARRSAA